MCYCLLLASLRNAKNELAFTSFSHCVLCFALIAITELNVDGYRIVIFFFDLFLLFGRSPIALCPSQLRAATMFAAIVRHLQGAIISITYCSSAIQLATVHSHWVEFDTKTVATQTQPLLHCSTTPFTGLHCYYGHGWWWRCLMAPWRRTQPSHLSVCLPAAASEPIDREKAKWTVQCTAVQLSWAARN